MSQSQSSRPIDKKRGRARPKPSRSKSNKKNFRDVDLHLFSRCGFISSLFLVPAMLMANAVQGASQSPGKPQELTQEKMDSIISSIRAAGDAITIRCVGTKDTNFFTISESLQGIYRTNTAINDEDFFLANLTWLEGGRRFESRVIFKESNIIFGTLLDGKVLVEMNLDRTNLTMSQDISLLGIPIHDGAQCEVTASRKQF